MPDSVDARSFDLAAAATPAVAPDVVAPAGLFSAERRALTVGLLLVVILTAFEGLAIATAMPVVERDLGGLRLYGLVFSAYMVANLIGTAYAGQQADEGRPAGAFGQGLALFALGLVISGLAPRMEVVIAGRAVQGLGSGAIATIAYVGIARGYEDEVRPRMFALLSSAWIVPGLIGPAVAGVLAQHVTWRLVFLALVPLLPLAALLTMPAFRRLTTVARPSGVNRRLGQSLRLAAGASMVLAGSSLSQPAIAAPLVAVGLIVSFFALRELLPAGTFSAAPGLPAAVATMGVICLGFFGAEAFLPLALNDVRGQSPTIAGLALTAATITWAAGAWLQARQARRWSRRTMVIVGFVIAGAGILIAGSAADARVPVWSATLGWAVGGFGMGLAYTNISLTILGEAPEHEVGAASASLQLANVLGVAAGTGIGGAVIAMGASGGWSTATSVGIVFALMAAFSLLATGVAMRLPDRPMVE